MELMRRADVEYLIRNLDQIRDLGQRPDIEMLMEEGK